MATLKENINKAISDFDSIETAIEDCGVDVPYDTDTSEYGDKVREVYAKGLSESGGEPLVYNAKTHYDFPSVGDVNVIYKAQEEKMIYQWNPTELKYEALGAVDIDTDNIKLIYGGDAYGNS